MWLIRRTAETIGLIDKEDITAPDVPTEVKGYWWEVGYYLPNGEWYWIARSKSRGDAGKYNSTSLCSYLNGGDYPGTAMSEMEWK